MQLPCKQTEWSALQWFRLMEQMKLLLMMHTLYHSESCQQKPKLFLNTVISVAILHHLRDVTICLWNNTAYVTAKELPWQLVDITVNMWRATHPQYKLIYRVLSDTLWLNVRNVQLYCLSVIWHCWLRNEGHPACKNQQYLKIFLLSPSADPT